MSEKIDTYVVLVTGTHHRDHPDVWRWLDALVEKRGHPAFVFVGCADGVDKQVRAWCKERGAIAMVGTAAWVNGKSAGPDRNAIMVTLTGLMNKLMSQCVALAFPCPLSKGTWDCVNRAKGCDLEVHVNRRLLDGG